MINNILNSDTYKDLTSKQVKELIIYLKENNIEFNLTVNLNIVKFNPRLPDKIYNSMNQFTLFSLKNFTFSSLLVKENHIEFETGFGSSNFGSVCSIFYTSIFQIGIEDSILFINPIASVEKYNNKLSSKEEEQRKKSFNAFNKLK